MIEVVVFDGIHNIGKTTLAKKVSEELKLPLKPEMSAMILKDVTEIIDFTAISDTLARYYTQKAIFWAEMAKFEYFMNKLTYSSLHEDNPKMLFIADRSPLSVVGYSRAFGFPITKDEKDRLNRIVHKIKHVFLFVPSKKFLKNLGQKCENKNVPSFETLNTLIMDVYEEYVPNEKISKILLSDITDMDNVYEYIVPVIKSFMEG